MTSPAGNVVLTTDIPSGTEDGGLLGSGFNNLLQIQSQKGKKIKSPAAEQRSSAQGCTVRAKAAQNRAHKGVFSVPQSSEHFSKGGGSG